MKMIRWIAVAASLLVCQGCLIIGYSHDWHFISSYSGEVDLSAGDDAWGGGTPDVEEYRGMEVRSYSHGLNWNFAALWFFVPLGLPYPTRDRRIAVLDDGVVIGRFDSSETYTFHAFVCNFIFGGSLFGIQTGCFVQNRSGYEDEHLASIDWARDQCASVDAPTIRKDVA